MKFQIALPIPSKSLSSLALLLLTCLLEIYFAMKFKESLMFFESKVKCSIDPWSEMEWKEPLQRSCMFMTLFSCVLCVVEASLLSSIVFIVSCCLANTKSFLLLCLIEQFRKCIDWIVIIVCIVGSHSFIVNY